MLIGLVPNLLNNHSKNTAKWYQCHNPFIKDGILSKRHTFHHQKNQDVSQKGKTKAQNLTTRKIVKLAICITMYYVLHIYYPFVCFGLDWFLYKGGVLFISGWALSDWPYLLTNRGVGNRLVFKCWVLMFD